MVYYLGFAHEVIVICYVLSCRGIWQPCCVLTYCHSHLLFLYSKKIPNPCWYTFLVVSSLKFWIFKKKKFILPDTTKSLKHSCSKNKPESTRPDQNLIIRPNWILLPSHHQLKLSTSKEPVEPGKSYWTKVGVRWENEVQ